MKHNELREEILDAIPSDWDLQPLSDLVSFTRKPRGLKLTDNIPFIPMELLPLGKIFIDGYELRNNISSGTYCELGDILLPKITPSFENGKQGIVDNIPQEFAFATTEVIPIKPSKHIDRLFLFYYFLHKPVRNELAGKMEGTTGRQRIPKSVVEELLIPLPPLPEQRAIAHVLTTVRQAIEATERVIEAARELKRSMMKHLFTYGPVPIDQADQVALKETEIEEVPDEWVISKFGEYIEIQSGQVDPKELPFKNMLHIGPENIEEATGRLLPLTTAGNLKLKSGKYYFDADNVVYSKIRPYLRKVALPGFEGVCSADMYPLRPKDKSIIKEFLYHFLLSDVFTEQAISYQSRTGIPKINRAQLNSTVMPIPSSSSQTEMASILSNLDKKKNVEINYKVALETLFQSLLHHLMTGKVRVGTTGTF